MIFIDLIGNYGSYKTNGGGVIWRNTAAVFKTFNFIRN
jgi:hypothetical protein